MAGSGSPAFFFFLSGTHIFSRHGLIGQLCFLKISVDDCQCARKESIPTESKLAAPVLFKLEPHNCNFGYGISNISESTLRHSGV